MRKARSYPRTHSITLLERELSMVLRSFQGSIFKSFDPYGVNFFLSAYCSNVHGVHLWHSYRSSVSRKFTVCFNNAARMFFGYHRFCSASDMFVNERRIDNFMAMYRKAVYGFMTRLSQTDNRIVSSLYESDLACYSSIRRAWCSALYSGTILM